MGECMELVKKLDIENKVTFTGCIGGEEKNSALKDAGVIVQMSRHEQVVWAPFETVLCGTPVIVTQDFGAEEDVKRFNAGGTVMFREIELLFETINSVFESCELGLSKTQVAKDYILSKMFVNSRTQEYTDVYQRAIDNGERLIK